MKRSVLQTVSQRQRCWQHNKMQGSSAFSDYHQAAPALCHCFFLHRLRCCSLFLRALRRCRRSLLNLQLQGAFRVVRVALAP